MITEERDGPLASMDVKDFVLTVGSRSPTPGGGSVAALCASLVSNQDSSCPYLKVLYAWLFQKSSFFSDLNDLVNIQLKMK